MHSDNVKKLSTIRICFIIINIILHLRVKLPMKSPKLSDTVLKNDVLSAFLLFKNISPLQYQSSECYIKVVYIL